MDVRVTGGADLAALRAALRQVNDKALSRQLSRGLSKAGAKLAPEIRKEIPKAMPSGYAPVLARSMRTRMQVRERSGWARVQIKVYGDGQKERRDVPSLNKGELRHPVHGRSRRLKRGGFQRNPWVAQKVRKGFVDRPADRLVPEVSREMESVVQSITEQITKG